MRVVSPFRPFAPESPAHLKLGEFDWIGAARMLATSVQRSNRCETLVLTDVDTALPVPALQFQTAERRLMLWILEVSLRYLESNAFDQDTVMVSPDALVVGELGRYFVGDLAVLVRPAEKYQTRPHHPVINAAQWWPVRSQVKLVTFYQQALAIARILPEHLLIWGADTAPLVQLLQPIVLGLHERSGLLVSMLDTYKMLGGIPTPGGPPILHFKYKAKSRMDGAYRQLVGAQP